MRFRGAGRALMATGVVCLIIYVLANLYGVNYTALRVGNILLFVGIVSIVIGIALRLSRTSPRV
jgi:small-conductance mechanosensitive channel